MKIKKVMKSLFIFVSIAFIGCHSENIKEPFFNFDQVTHYNINIVEKEISNIWEKGNFSPKDQMLINVLEESLSGSPKDTLFISGLTMLGYNSKTIAKENHHDLEELFSYKGILNKPAELHKCISKFRDILVFRHQSKISGIAKICFDCDLSSFSGAKSTTSHFGGFSEYYKLEKILQE